MKLPELDSGWGGLYDVIVGQISSNLMLAGIRLKIFNHMSEPASADEVADAIGGHPENTRFFLDGLVAADLVVKKDGRYRNSPVAQQYLVEGSTTYLGTFFEVHCRMQDISPDVFVKLVTGGPRRPGKEVEARSVQEQGEANDTMASTQLAGGAQQAVEIISGLPEFPSIERMLDLGGGPGLICCAIVSAHPTMRGVVFDLPPVAEAAEKYVRQYSMADRVDIMGGDYNNDSIGEGYDLVWSSGALFSAADLDSLAKKVRGALNPGGVWVNMSEGLTHERTRPKKMVLAMLFYTMTAGDVMFDRGVVADSMRRAGFDSVESRTIETNWGPLDVDVGRK